MQQRPLIFKALDGRTELARIPSGLTDVPRVGQGVGLVSGDYVVASVVWDVPGVSSAGF
jgi:hypothetical protein